MGADWEKKRESREKMIATLSARKTFHSPRLKKLAFPPCVHANDKMTIIIINYQLLLLSYWSVFRPERNNL